MLGLSTRSRTVRHSVHKKVLKADKLAAPQLLCVPHQAAGGEPSRLKDDDSLSGSIARPSTSRIWFVAQIVVASMMTIGATMPADVSPLTVYVSSTGSDLNKGLSMQQAFRTPARAIDAIEANPAVRTVYFTGSFDLATPIRVNKNMAGTKWAAAPGSSATFRATKHNSVGILVGGADGVTVADLTFHGFSESAILVESGRRAKISGNTVLETRSTTWSQGGIHLRGSSAGGVITRNRVIGADYAGIISDTNASSDISDLEVSYNLLIHTCRIVLDCGAIYINDRGKASRRVKIIGNTIRDFGPIANLARGIYLDDWATGTLVSGNHISGSGGYAFQIHGGSDNLITKNTVDLSHLAGGLVYQRSSELKAHFMLGNRFSLNRFISLQPLQRIPTRPADPASEGELILENNRYCLVGKYCPLN